jgi:hypothetical protein
VVGNNNGRGKVRHLSQWKTESEIVDEVGICVEKVVFVEKGFESLGIVWANNFSKNVG